MSSPFRTVFLPAMLVSGAVFTVATLPLSLNQSVPTWVVRGSQPASVFAPQQSAQPVIRYIGLSIVASVAAGMGTAELLRRWQRPQRPLAPPDARSGDSAPIEAPIKALSFEDPLNGPAADVGSPPAAADDISFTALVAATEKASIFKPINFEPAEPVRVAALSHPATHRPTALILDFSQVTPLHVTLPAPAGRQITFAIAHQQRYYCLVRTATSLDTVQTWASQLGDRDTLITRQPLQFALWQHQLEAKPVGPTTRLDQPPLAS